MISRGDQFSLLNSCNTEINFSKRSYRDDLIPLLVRMEELNVPFGYTEELEEIYFTMLPQNHGDYVHGRIRLSTTKESLRTLERTFVHELGHHMDNMEDISERPGIIDEKRHSARYMSDTYARSSVGEYIAVGFEVYYLGSREQRRRMRETNPKLYNVIGRIHRKYQRR